VFFKNKNNINFFFFLESLPLICTNFNEMGDEDDGGVGPKFRLTKDGKVYFKGKK
jgi:hypothetical protein